MKSITFRPTETALKALAILMADGGNRSQAINRALVSAVADPGETEKAIRALPAQRPNVLVRAVPKPARKEKTNGTQHR